MSKRLIALIVLLVASESRTAVFPNIFRDAFHGRAETMKRIVTLRKMPVTLSFGTDYILHHGMPQRSGLQRFVFELYQGAAALTELLPHATTHALINALIALWLGPNVVLHEVGGHGHANLIFLKEKSIYSRTTGQKSVHKPFLKYLPGGLFSYSGSTASSQFFERENWPEAFRAYKDLDEAIETSNHVLKKQSIKTLLANKKNFDYFRRTTKASYAGINMEIEQAHYVSQRILQGEVVRPETVIAYAVSGVFTYLQSEGSGVGNDANAIQVYYDAIGCRGGVKRARMLSIVGMFCSGTFWAFSNAYWRMDRVRPIWLFDRLMMPNFYVFYTDKGYSLFVESAVRINDRVYVDFGTEWVVDGGKDPFTGEKYSAAEFRLGGGWRWTPNLFVGAYSLLNHFGGGAELTYTNQSKHFGMSMGATWASDKSLSGERMANYSFNSQGRDVSGYVRLSYVI